MARILQCMMLISALLLTDIAQAACGAMPSDWPAWAGTKLKVESLVKVNGLNVTKNEYTGSYGVNPTTGAVQATTLAMPTLDPAAYPTFSGGSNLTTPAPTNSPTVTVAPGTYGTITVTNWQTSPSVSFSGGGPYYIDTLSISPLARVQFAPGDYYIRRLTMGNNASITVAAGGAVRIYINSDISWGNDLRINHGGSAANLQLYLYPGVSEAKFGNGTWLTGVVYAPDPSQEIEAGSGTIFTGALLAAGELKLNNNVTLNFNATVQAQVASVSTCSATLLGEYRFDESAWGGDAGAVKDTSGNNRHATAIGSPLPVPANTSPARTGNPGTCGYGVFSGPAANGGAVRMTGLPVNTTASTRNSVSFWMYWTSSAYGVAVGWNAYDLYLSGSTFGFNSYAGDWYYTTIAGAARWIHVVAIFTNGNESLSELYIDGVKRTLAMSGAANNANTYATTTLLIGGMGATSNYRLVNGRVDEVKVYAGALSSGQITALYNETHPCGGTGLHHLEISDSTSGSGLTCTPSTLTLRACADAACGTLYTGGVTGTLTATAVSGSPTANWGGGTANFTIPSGSSSVTKTLQLTSVNTTVSATLGATSAAPNPVTCTFTGCLYTAANSGFQFDVPDHVAATAQSVVISAVRKADNANICIPAFASVSKTVQMNCAYQNPASGTLPVVVNGVPLNPTANVNAQCASANPVTLAFDAGGRATATFAYADVGRMGVTVGYAGSAATGDAGLSMNGTDPFIAAPASIGFSGIPAAPLTAGTPFNATVTVRNAAGNATPNFGNETVPATVAVTSSNYIPGLGNGSPINASYSGFSAGQSSRNLIWDEVGTIDLNAAVSDYLGSGLNASGLLAGAGRFKPAWFTTAVTQGCAAGAYTYSGQPFTVRTTAYAADGGVTANYGGATWGRTTTLSAIPGSGGALSNATVAATEFAAGVATHATTAFTFTAPKTVPATITLRATDTDGVTSAGVTSGEGAVLIRSGRLALGSNYGSELLPLTLPLETQFWQEGGNTASTADDFWTQNTADGCTTIAAVGISLSNFRPGSDPGLKSGETSIGGVAAVAAGRGGIILTAPGATNSGSVDVTVNTTTAGIPWLGGNPVARATFGLRKTPVIHLRENF